jgi:hypothetical protein
MNGHCEQRRVGNGASSNGQGGNISLSFMTPVEEDFTARGDGSVELTASYPGAEQGSVLRWKSVSASKGFVDLNQTLGYAENAVAYRLLRNRVNPSARDGAEVWQRRRHQSVDQRPGRARMGRPARSCAGSDQQAIHLEAGVNRVLVKVSQYNGGWGFSVGIPKANF